MLAPNWINLDLHLFPGFRAAHDGGANYIGITAHCGVRECSSRNN